MLLSLGCGKKADRAACHQACEHVAQLRTAPITKQAMAGLHELDEREESMEDQAKDNIARLKKELAAGSPQPDRARRLTGEAKRKIAEQQRYEAEQLKKERESAILREQQALDDEHKSVAAAKSKAMADLQKALAEAVSKCESRCGERSEKDVACLVRTQAIEDIAICENR